MNMKVVDNSTHTKEMPAPLSKSNCCIIRSTHALIGFATVS